MNAPTPRDTPEIQKATRTRVALGRVIAVAILVTFVVSVISFYIGFGDRAKQSTTRAALNGIEAGNARADCKTEYNSYRATVIERRNTIALSAQQDIIGYLLGVSSTEQLMTNRAALTAANASVDALPTLSEMADDGFKDENGITHPPCPRVS